MASIRVLSFADVLKRFRAAAGLTQEELADRAGLSPKGISDLERGARRSPRRETVSLLADALALPERDRAILGAAARQRTPPPGPLGAPAASGATLPRPAPPLVGRSREVGLIGELVAGDAPPLLLFVGEPSIGKSRLLQEAAARAAEHGWAVLAGGCHRRSGQELYAPFLAALAARLARQSSQERKSALEGCAWLVRLLPELAEIVAPPAAAGLAPEQERRLVFAAVARHLANVSGPAGTLLVLDDLQWAGEDALDLLASLARSSAGCPLRVVGAYRDTDVRPGDPLAALVADLAREGALARAPLAPLAGAEARNLLDALLAEPGAGGSAGVEAAALRAQVLLRTGGVPFFLVSCVRGMRALRAGGDGVVPELPWTVAETIRQRLAALPGAARELLEVAAVVGREAPRTLLLAMTDRPRAEALAALDEAVRARLLDEVGDHAYAFPHDLEREVAWTDLSSARRAALHRGIAEALEARDAGRAVEALAYHYAHAGEDEKAIVYLERAGDRALERFAAAEAERYFRELAERLDSTHDPSPARGGGPSGSAARAREKLAEALTALLRYDEACAALGSAVEAYRALGDLGGQARATAQLGRVCARGGRAGEGLARVRSLLVGLDGREGDVAAGDVAALYESLAWLLDAERRWDEALEACGRAAERARAAGDPRLLARIEMLRGGALLPLGRMDESMAVLARAEALGGIAEAARGDAPMAEAPVAESE